MRIAIIIISSMFCMNLKASNIVDFNLKLFIDGEKVSSSRIVAKKGQNVFMEKENSEKGLKTKISFIANDGKIHERKGILVKLKIDFLKKGGKSITFKPEFLVTPGQEAIFEIGNESLQKERIKLSMLLKEK